MNLWRGCQSRFNGFPPSAGDQTAEAVGSAEFITSTGRFEIRAGETFDPARAIVRPASAEELDRIDALLGGAERLRD
ncbi:MAG: hypothetical protein KGS61_16120 [Verrucomicrobia bacterium]|nr:hypothetical protein [Verrucomicrobiota bacterium]